MWGIGRHTGQAGDGALEGEPDPGAAGWGTMWRAGEWPGKVCCMPGMPG